MTSFDSPFTESTVIYPATPSFLLVKYLIKPAYSVTVCQKCQAEFLDPLDLTDHSKEMAKQGDFTHGGSRVDYYPATVEWTIEPVDTLIGKYNMATGEEIIDLEFQNMTFISGKNAYIIFQ